MTLLHEHFAYWWDSYIEQVPQTWLVDKFFVNNVPIIISCRYGQNERVGVTGTMHRELQQWAEARTWNKIRQVTVSIATEIRCCISCWPLRYTILTP